MKLKGEQKKSYRHHLEHDGVIAKAKDADTQKAFYTQFDNTIATDMASMFSNDRVKFVPSTLDERAEWEERVAAMIAWIMNRIEWLFGSGYIGVGSLS